MTKKWLAWIMAVMMVLSLLPVQAFAAGPATVSLEFEGAPFLTSDTERTVRVNIVTDQVIHWSAASLQFGFDASNPVALSYGTESGSAGNVHAPNLPAGRIVLGNNTGEIDTDYLGYITIKIPANAPAGTYKVNLTLEELTDDNLEDVDIVSNSITSSFTISEPTSQPNWEIYYTLDSAIDSDADKYIEYNPGDTVVATIYLKAKVADTLQAFDFTVTNDENLEYKSYTSANGTRIESGTNQSDETKQHIQAVGADKTNPINVAMAANTGVAIATITYQVKDAAVYDTGLPITITAADFAVANNPASFTPEIQNYSSDTLGVETLKKYTVTYDENKPTEAASLSVTGMPDPLTADKGHNVAHTVAAAPSLTNYTFDGWNTAADGSGDNYAAAGSYTANADVTLYAQWTADTHQVLWKSQDGNSTLETDAAVAYGATLSYDGSEPTKDADAQYTYTFAGWSTTANSETGAAANTFTMGDADMVLYAAFSKTTNNYTVTWKSQDGNSTLETDTDVPYGTQPEYNGSEPQKAADETYTYAFAGWADSVNQESGTEAASLPTVDGNETYYAAFSKTYIDYTVSYALGDHAADGETAPASETKHNGETVTLPAGPAAADGYEFSGWSDGTNTYGAGDTYTISGAGATMTAQYAEKTYTVAYDGNTSTGGTAPASHTSQSFTADFTAAANSFEKTGYTFNGWNTKADGSGTPVTAGNVYKISTLGLDSTALAGTTVTLYAQWVRESDYAISYELNGGSLAEGVTNPTSYNVDTPTFTLNNPTKTGYTFKGWSGTDLTGDENTTVTIAKGSTGIRSYTANWTPAEVNYTVEHYRANLDGTYSATADETETLQGYTESDTAAVAKTGGDYTGFTAEAFSQIPIAADGSTVVKIYYARNTHTVTYEYTGTAPAGAPAVPVDANSPYKFGATVNVDQNEVSVPHYDFSGWQKDGAAAPASFVMGDADVVISGYFTEHTYTIKFWNLEEGETGNTVLSEQTYTESTQGSISVPTVPAKDWYDANGWTAYTLFSAEEINVYPQYTEHAYTITFQDEDGNDLADQGTDNTFTKSDPSITPPAVPEKPGYTGAWPTLPTDTPADASVQPVYTAIHYTLKFNTDGGAAIADIDYTIETDPLTLPSASGKTNYSFVKWNVELTDTEASWATGASYNAGNYSGKYGNVTLKAEWTVSLNYSLEEYKYAPTGYKMLIVDAAGAGDGQVYQYSGGVMYYTTDSNYMITKEGVTSTAVFYTLVEEATFTVDKIAAAAGTQETINYNGDVNGDGKINIADANAIFQMVVATGSYYSLDQLSIAQRLAADMIKATDNAEHRGSIEDVNAVVAIINGTN